MIFIPSIFIYQNPHSSIVCIVPFSKAISVGWKTKIHITIFTIEQCFTLRFLKFI